MSPDEQDLANRIRALELAMEWDKRDRDERRKELDHALGELRTMVLDIRTEMTRYKGMLGGMALVGTMLWAGLVFVKEGIVGVFSGR
jgi:hypothetical protein